MTTSCSATPTPPSFSTRTQLLDLSHRPSLGDLEDFTATKDGKMIDAIDRNYSGVTFGAGDHFYAALSNGGQRYLVKGDLSSRTVEVVTDDVECPSLSPDGSRIASAPPQIWSRLGADRVAP